MMDEEREIISEPEDFWDEECDHLQAEERYFPLRARVAAQRELTRIREAFHRTSDN